MEQRFISIEEIQILIVDIAFRLPKFDWYVAISRGGLVPTCLLSQKTGVDRIESVCASSYCGIGERGQIRLETKNFHHLDGQRVLVIDDLVDSGSTMKAVVEMLRVEAAISELRTAVVYRKEHARFIPDYWGMIEEHSTWLEFPWERF